MISVSKSSRVATICDFFDLKNMHYKFRKNSKNHQNIWGDRPCEKPGGLPLDEKILASHYHDINEI
jgi:hypothetical protein